MPSGDCAEKKSQTFVIGDTELRGSSEKGTRNQKLILDFIHQILIKDIIQNWEYNHGKYKLDKHPLFSAWLQPVPIQYQEYLAFT